MHNLLQSCGRSVVHTATFIFACSPLSHCITHFSREMSYLFQLLLTEFIFSLLGLQETVQFLFLLGLNMLLKLLFFIGHHFSLQQISSKSSLSPNRLQFMSNFSPKDPEFMVVTTIFTTPLDKSKSKELVLTLSSFPIPSRHPVPHSLSPIVQLILPNKDQTL